MTSLTLAQRFLAAAVVPPTPGAGEPASSPAAREPWMLLAQGLLLGLVLLVGAVVLRRRARRRRARGHVRRFATLALLALLMSSPSASAQPASPDTSGAVAMPPLAAAVPDRRPRIRSLGHAGFDLDLPGGPRVLIDPPPPSLGYPPVKVAAEVVLVSHPHFDHNFLGAATGAPVVLDGVDAKRKRVRRIDTRVGALHVRTLATWHDRVEGLERGPNAVFLLSWRGLRLAHLGDLGHTLDKDGDLLEALRGVDVLMVPAGGSFTLGPREASRLAAAISPRCAVLPMHLRGDSLRMKLPLVTVDRFRRLTPHSERLSGWLDLACSPRPDRPRTIILEPTAPATPAVGP